ncbi:MAG TPA: YeeE/YedE thiosulfate transporter family protein [Saprospiraceae bacterium]|nr:YeeE/YedE family protein [Saprospiraceae bacterium]MCB9270348.1 YeeE/YedE family protein [Lewinellaceae bacterium]HPG08506.1 YeeE/YedE thiosulfate transporter family protein [Saprospiraceae bacterium]HPQ98281.1 YeeE/YedE thiosulfate transporter family protein [Saprospiraceae bacterium]HQU54475.1 YeeE/YedE thiosulfate transporter family protein [Saprospiraceae bacterium]
MVPQFLLDLKDWISQPWPWYVGGPMIAIIMFILLWFGREFGISANFRVMCAADGAGEFADFFKFDWSSQGWNLLVALGAMFGGYLASHYFIPNDGDMAHVSAATVASLQNLGMDYQVGHVPLVPEFYSWEALFSLQGILVIVVGGFLVGFGARYAGGCTSGHAISGISALQLPSMVAVVGFFMGGLVMIHFLYPLIFK